MPAAGRVRVAIWVHTYVPLSIFMGVALAIPLLITLLVETVSSRRPDPVKYVPYESGYPTTALGGRVRIECYVSVMLLVMWVVGAAAFRSWAGMLRVLGTYGLAAVALFLLVFVLGDLYVWKKGGFEWR